MTDSFSNNSPRSFMSLINQQKEISAVKNKDLIEQICLHEAFINLMMIGEIEALVHLMRIDIKNAGMLKHNIKKECNILLKYANRMQSLASVVDRRLTIRCCKAILPGCEKRFADDTGSAIIGLQNRFHLLLKNRLELFFICLRQVAKNAKYEHPEVYARTYLVGALTSLSLEISESYIHTLKNKFGILLLHDTQNERAIIASVNRMIAAFWKRTLTEKEVQDIKCHTNSMTNLITGKKVVDILENTELELYHFYCEYFLAVLQCDIRNKGHIPSFTMRRSLLFKLNNKKGVCSLLAELQKAPQREEGEDMYEFSIRLSEYHAPVMDEFRGLVLRGICRSTPVEENRIEIKRLIREVRENDGTLPLGALRKIYSTVGSKQALMEYIAQMGERGKETIKFLEMLNEKNLDRNYNYLQS
ncbi:hypothetical protein EZS27_032689 [termite gut metagenome]|uniref:Uncharacterized protein n=1 Tax=termite gut metagenome TaxID=433724 RepID=A0A5J4Q5T3_9ZZZZ